MTIDPDYGAVTGPVPVLSRRRRGDSLAALRSRNYRLYFVGQIFANSGSQMAGVAVDWLVLELSHDVALVGLAVTIGFLPTLVLGPWAGVLSDRVSRRRTLIICMSASTVSSATIAILALTGRAQVWEVLVAAGVGGVATAIDQPSRSAFLGEMVGRDRLSNAIALTAVVYQFSGLLGPGLSGVLIAVAGSGWSIAIGAVTTFISVAAIAMMRPAELYVTVRPVDHHGGIRTAARYIAGKPTIVWALVLLAVVSIFSMNRAVLLSASASSTFDSGSAGYGFSSALTAAGALAGAVLAARFPIFRIRSIAVTAVALGAVTVVGAVPVLGVFLPAIVAGGALQLVFTTADETITQLSTNPILRGRVMALFLVVTFGGRAVGGALLGAVTQTGGPITGFVLAGSVPIVVGTIVAIVVREPPPGLGPTEGEA